MKPGGWEDYPLDELAIREERRAAIDVVRRLVAGRFRLDPDFQRDFVWEIDKQSRLIESVLMRIPLPVFYVAEDTAGLLIVVDGRQRLTTLQRFLQGQLILSLPDRPELNGKKFLDLEPRLQNRVEDCQLHFYIIDRTVPERARLDIFERVNGGEVLTRQQMRNAIYSGSATNFLKTEAESDLFKEATGGSLNSKKMQDREFVNRFCSFSLLPFDSYKGDMDDWLARGLVRLSKMSALELDSLRTKFRLGLENNLVVFGRHAFRKHRQPLQARSILNASLFDAMMAEMSVRDLLSVSEKAEDLRQAFYSQMENPVFTKAITYGPNSPKEVRARFKIAGEIFKEVFDA
ncbi:DUF262 domain-containing protein [Sphaerotilus sp.]|uniref:DUF262 domain-containing protein n=1 Tax=Sphaerotilus sp. TaxID=2093942 RepID=UPI002ACE80E3|nr:DUF262 domain-containing protein [Sphaerotilus sp.]MDZ7854672.1 DUF262 domain-containing protein [Sphaerotilus sp.]